jgi:copper transport protein
MSYRAVARCLAGALVIAAFLLALGGPAFAHAELESSQPGYGDVLSAAPGKVILNFSEPMELAGARLSLSDSRGRALPLRRPAFGSPDRRTVAVGLPTISPSRYTLTWFFLGNDGHVMGGEVAFQLAGATPAVAPSAPRAPVAATPPAFPGTAAVGTIPNRIAEPRFGAVALAGPEAVVRILDYSSLAVLIGGGVFVAGIWREGAKVARVRRLLWIGLAGSALATFLTLGLTAAGLQGLPTLDAVRPSVIEGVLGTRLALVLAYRGGFLILGALVLGLLTVGRDQAARSRGWRLAGAVAGLGVLTTYSFLGHASEEGPTAQAANLIHMVGVAVWLGGLIFLTTMVLPRRRPEELRVVIPRFSSLAFGSVAVMVMAGVIMLTEVVPRLGSLLTTGYGRLLLLKLGLVGVLLVVAQQARSFTERRLVLAPAGDDRAAPLQPLLLAVGVELALAFVILSSTSVLVGQLPPR